jgi:chromosome segregation ATPase
MIDSTWEDLYNQSQEEIALLDEQVKHLQKLLCDLTPGGSEFVDNPQNCFEWIKRRIDDAVRNNVRLVGERNEVQRKITEANQKLEQLEAELDSVYEDMAYENI